MTSPGPDHDLEELARMTLGLPPEEPPEPGTAEPKPTTPTTPTGGTPPP